jgi:hypothetical protein
MPRGTPPAEATRKDSPNVGDEKISDPAILSQL